jgi:hypothetical protein
VPAQVAPRPQRGTARHAPKTRQQALPRPCTITRWVAMLGVLCACSADGASTDGSPRRGVNRAAAGSIAVNPGALPSTGAAGADIASPIGGGVIPNATPGTSGRVDSTTCARGMSNTAPVTPTVWLIVDGSGSMKDDFEAGRSRWVALRSTLMDPGGVVDNLQASVRFGMVIYAGDDGAECVRLITVEPALNNMKNLASQYPMDPLGNGTPTDKALDHVVTTLPVLNQAKLDEKTDPIYVVLATDGQPNDMCEGRGGGRDNSKVEQNVIDITARGTQMGMQMFVISLAGDDTRLQSHLMMVANATASKTPPYVPSTQADLVAAFRKIVGGASCQVQLDGTVKQGQECGGMVQLNGKDLACNTTDGWKLTDPRTVQLTGTACETFLASTSLVTAKFACDIFMPD